MHTKLVPRPPAPSPTPDVHSDWRPGAMRFRASFVPRSCTPRGRNITSAHEPHTRAGAPPLARGGQPISRKIRSAGAPASALGGRRRPVSSC